ncbi:phage tail tip protein J-related protein [Vibrio vulnificus]
MVWQIYLAWAVAIASAAYSYHQAKKMQDRSDSGERGGIGVTRFGTDKSLPVVYGKRKVKPVIVYQGVKDVHDDDVTNETYYAILVWGIGPVSKISDIKFDDRPYTDFGGFGGSQRIETQLGDRTQTMPEWFADEAPDDMSGMHFKGLAVTYVKLAMDKEYKRYPQGRPDFSAVIEARSDNPVEALYDYFTNTEYGLGFPAEDWDDEFNGFMAAYCNSVVDGHKLMTCNVVLDTAKPLIENVHTLLQNCRGYLVEGQSGLRVEIDRQKEPVLHITESMLTSGMSTTSVNINQRYNQVTIRFPDRDLDWETNEVVFPPKDSELHQQWLAEDAGVPLTHEETADAIDNYHEALQYAEVIARLSRDGMTLSISVKSIVGWRVEEMDVVTVESQLRGWEAKPFSVREIEYGESETKLKLVEYQDSHFLYHPKPPKPDYPDTQLPNPLEVAPPSGLSFSLTEHPSAYGVLKWQAPAGFIDSYDVRILGAGQVIWQQNSKTESISIPYLLSGEYQFSVRALGPLAASGWSVLTVNFDAPESPFSVEVDAGNTYLILRPSSNGLAFGTEYEFWFNNELRGRGVAWQIEGLQPATEYTFQVRAVNAVGQSGFVNVAGTTTKDASTIIDILDGKITHEILDAQLKDFLAQVDATGKENASALEQVKGELDGVAEHLGELDRQAQDAAEVVFGVTSAVESMTQEYERRLLEGETLVDAVVYRDPETGQIINKAFAYTEAKYTEAGIAINGVAASVAITAQEVKRVERDTGTRISQAEAAILVNAGAINLKASYSDVTEIVSGALAALTPAYSWQFNTSVEGWQGATWTPAGTITGSVFTRAEIDFNADENSVVRLRLKAEQNGLLCWNGGAQNVQVKHPGDTSAFETVILTLNADNGWSGSITSLTISMNAEIDFIEIGKPSAAELQLQDIAYRMATVEQELDPENARWGVYVTQDYWDTNALTLTDVKQEIDGWDATWGITATLKQLDENNTLEKANSAALWVNAAESNITSVVASYNAKPGGTDDQLAQASDRLNTAEQQIDAVKGQISQTVSSLNDVENALGQFDGLDDLLDAYNEFLQAEQDALLQVQFSYAQQKITANSDDIASQAQAILNLLAVQGGQQAALTRMDRAIANQTSALAETKEQLEAKISDGDSETLAKATTYTKTAVGYCLDKDGNITSHEDAVLCVQAGHEWIDGPLAAFIRNLSIRTADGGSASVSQLSQAFVTEDGQLMAKGGLTTNVNGHVSGMVNTNTGEQSSLDFLANHARFGIMENGQFIPLMHLDSTGRKLRVYGQMILGDGYLVDSVADIRAQDGKDGVDGKDGLNGKDGQDGSTIYTEFQFSADGQNWHFPDRNGDRYLRSRVVTNGVAAAWGNTTNLQGPTGEAGQDATERYTWIKYADSSSGSGLSDSSAGKSYIGIAHNKTTPVESTNPADYTWSLFKGADGQNGSTIYTEFQFSADGQNWHFPDQNGDRYLRSRVVTNGVAAAWGNTTNLQGPTGEAGQDATERYTWIKYADSSSGAGLSDSSAGKSYIGIAHNKTTPVESTNPADYTWSLFKGADGQDGQNGSDGKDGQHGAGFYTLTLRNGVFPANATANADFTAAYGRAPILDDHLTYRNAAGTASSTKRYTGVAWEAPSLILHGDLLAYGSVTGDRFKANTEISAPILRGGLGDFSGLVRAKDGSFVEKIEIGSVGGYRAYIKSVTNSGHNMIVVEGPSGDVMFAVQGNGNLYSIGGGYLNNLTIGEECTVLGKITTQQLVGDVASGAVVSFSQTQIKPTGTNYGAWSTFATLSGRNELDRRAALVVQSFTGDATLNGGSTGSSSSLLEAGLEVRVLINGVVMYTVSENLVARYSTKNIYYPSISQEFAPGEQFQIEFQARMKIRFEGAWGEAYYIPQKTCAVTLIPKGASFN